MSHPAESGSGRIPRAVSRKVSRVAHLRLILAHPASRYKLKENFSVRNKIYVRLFTIQHKPNSDPSRGHLECHLEATFRNPRSWGSYLQF